MWDALIRRARRWMRPRAPEPLPVQLDRHRIYVLPTAGGLFFAGLIGAMLLTALNFNNNPGLLLALLLAGAAHTSLLAAHLQLSGLRVEAIAAEPVPAGTPLHLRLALAESDGRPRIGVQIACGDVTTTVSLTGGSVTAELALATDRRGLLPLPRLTLSSIQPLGLVRAWAYVWPAQQLLVYPAAEPHAPPLPLPTNLQGLPQPERLGEDVHHLRDYRPGDAPRLIAWKPSARHETLLVRDAEQPRGGELVLDWQHTAGLPYEQRIRRLARWVEMAEQAGLRYGLRLPAQPPIPVGQGDAHRHRCLRALALLPQEALQ